MPMFEYSGFRCDWAMISLLASATAVLMVLTSATVVSFADRRGDRIVRGSGDGHLAGLLAGELASHAVSHQEQVGLVV